MKLKEPESVPALAEAVFEQREDALTKLGQAKAVLDAAIASGDVEKVDKANRNLADAKAKVEKAEATLRRFRGDDKDAEQTDTSAETYNRRLLATPRQLINAFGSFSGMNADWFKRLADKPGLAKARKVKGVAKKNASTPPLFCPYEVCNWLGSPKRKVGTRIAPTTAWRMLKAHFPEVHAEYQSFDPN